MPLSIFVDHRRREVFPQQHPAQTVPRVLTVVALLFYLMASGQVLQWPQVSYASEESRDWVDLQGLKVDHVDWGTMWILHSLESLFR